MYPLTSSSLQSVPETSSPRSHLRTSRRLPDQLPEHLLSRSELRQDYFGVCRGSEVWGSPSAAYLLFTWFGCRRYLFSFFFSPAISHHVFPFLMNLLDGAARLMRTKVIWATALCRLLFGKIMSMSGRTSKKHRTLQGLHKGSLVYSCSCWPHAGFTQKVFLLSYDASFFAPAPRKLASLFDRRIKCDCGCMGALFFARHSHVTNRHGVSFNVTGCSSHQAAELNITDDGRVLGSVDFGLCWALRETVSCKMSRVSEA